MNRAGGIAPSAKSGKYSYNSKLSKLSKQSKVSRMSKQSRVLGGANNITGAGGPSNSPIPEEDDIIDQEIECKPEDFVTCSISGRPLTEDEKIINARFVNEAIAAHRDISMFPMSIACMFE